MALKDYSDFFQFIDDIINGDSVDSKDGYLNIDNFNGVATDGLKEDMQNFWQGLLEYISSEANQEVCNGHGGIIRESDFGNHLKETVAQYINNRADLDNFRWSGNYESNEDALNAIFSYINAYID
ncbi:MAG: hypothetical protein LUC37_06830 [Prevotella sp.]|nr:hypothetical protein [Prevotella sp.]